jgi:sugar phosphate isomerase/epimerase
MRRSLVLSAFFPSSTSSEAALIDAIEQIAEEAPQVDTLEFFFEGGYSPAASKVLKALKKRSILLAAIKTKKEQLNLASREISTRNKAVDEVKRCIDTAHDYGSEALLINSGFAPDAPSDKMEAMRCLTDSIEELLSYAASNYNESIDLFMETGAMNQRSVELIGSTKTAIKIAIETLRRHSNFFLTLDTSHLLQLNENPVEAIANAASFVKHIHLANCVLCDPRSPMYGDMHPPFGEKNSELSNPQVAGIFESLKGLLKFKDAVVGLEVICREANEREFFRSQVPTLGWFFEKSTESLT